jgi:hypothetical protein
MELSFVQSDPDRAATEVALITAVIGTLLLAAPESVGRRGFIADPKQARILGAVDVVVAAGLLAGGRRAPWMAARAVATVGTAGFFGRIARSGPPTVGPALVAAGLLGMSVVDVGVVRSLHREGS